MIIVLEHGATPEQIQEVVAALEARRLSVRMVRAGGKPVLHVIAGNSRRSRRVRALDVVEGLVPTSGPRVRNVGYRVFPYHFIRWSAVGIVVLGILVMCAGQFPIGTGTPIDVQQPPADLREAWYARVPAFVLELFPAGAAWLGWLVALALMVAILMLPRLDRSSGAGMRERAPWLLAGALVLAGLIAVTFRGML